MTALPLPLEPKTTLKQQIGFAKFVLFLNALVPGALLAWDWAHGHAGVNPVNYAERTTGILTLIFLSLTLLVTPLRRLTGFNALFHFRRMLGLYAFFYGLSHFLIFFIAERKMDVGDTLSEMVKRTYLIIGSIGILAMVPLAATSFNFMIKKMGAKRWHALHRLTYVAAVAGGIHYWMQAKSDKRIPDAFLWVIGSLLAFRVLWPLLRLESGGAKGAEESATTPAARRWNGEVRVSQIVQETPDVRTFRLVPADGSNPFAYQPGQYLTLALDIAGKKIYRSYTIASTPTRPGTCEVTIKRDEKGFVSRHMHDTIKQGDLLRVAAPSGKFIFTGTEARSVALLAGGVGITPLMAILRYLADRKWDGDIYLVYSNKTEQDIIFRREIEGLQKLLPKLHVTFTLTRADASWQGATGRIDASLLRRMIPALGEMPIYLCGPTEMIAATRETLRQLGVAEANVHTESFGSRPASLIAEDTTSTHTITFARSHKSVTAGGTRPLLEIAEDLGVNIPFECRSGICGTCKCRILAGTVQMPVQDALDPDDRANRVILLCQARPLEDVTIDA